MNFESKMAEKFKFQILKVLKLKILYLVIKMQDEKF